jgi:kynurenine 3-monooxygenase
MVVVGAGLSGSVLAVFLARRGHQVDVFERHEDARVQRGARRAALNITLCERGLHALEAIGMREAVLALAVPARGRQVHALDGSVAYQPYGNHGEAIYSISRADLNQALVECAANVPGVRFHFEQKCTRVDLASASAQFEHATTGAIRQISADRIFGADGAYSAVRAQLQRTEQFNYSQEYWRLGGYKSLWLPARPDGKPALETERLHIWPRGSRMLIGFPNRDGSMMLSLLLPLRGEDSYESLSDAARVETFFRAAFPDIVDVIPALSEQFFAKPANSLLTVRCEPWSYEDRALLIGDAAHAILPSYGQGANAGFEDCAILDQCMAQHGGDWHAVFQEFERRRKPSLDVMADLCIEHFVELCELVGDPKFLKRREIERMLEERHPRLYRSLYSMVSFSRIPYAEAFAIEQRQRRAVDRIATIEGIEGKIDSPEVESILQEAQAEDPSATLDATVTAGAEPIFALAMSFWGAKALLSAVELGLFRELSGGPRTLDSLRAALSLHGRGAQDFLDALVALGVLSRSEASYANTPEAQALLVPESPTYIGGALELANDRLYPVWGKLTRALRTGEPQNEAQQEANYYDNLSRDPERLRTFLRGMSGLSMMAAKAIARKFPWRDYQTFADLGGAQGVLPAQLALAHSHLRGFNFDLPAVRSVAEEYLESLGLASRIRFQGGDFFNDPLPAVDVLVMGHVLHNWDLAQKRRLIERAYESLVPGGALIVYEALLDEQREKRAFGLLMSLNMLLVTPGGFVFRGSDCQTWMQDAGFEETYVEHLHGSDWMVVGIKPAK